MRNTTWLHLVNIDIVVVFALVREVDQAECLPSVERVD